ncbi:hypothetical protein BsWGS_08033 [Bradybaena similaris]
MMAQVTPRQEAAVFVLVNFYRGLPGGKAEKIFQDQCLIDTLMYGNKQDFERQLGPPDSQMWYYNGVLLLNERTLKSYEIEGTDEIDIIVKSSN